MTATFQLLYGYRHCFGKTEYVVGTVATEEEAQAWVNEKQHNSGKGILPPENEPLRTCPVVGCPAKLQKPWFSYRSIAGADPE